MFQECPICKGNGNITVSDSINYVNSTCPTCNGTRIISALTGLPPASSKKEETVDKCSAECVCDGSCQPTEWMGMRNREDFSNFLNQLFKA